MTDPLDMAPASGSITIINARAVLPDSVVEHATIHIAEGIITAIEQGDASSSDTATVFDARNAYVIPGIIDTHNDNLEHEINPRAKANLPIHFALGNMERRLAASGVTTEFHSISFQDQAKKGRSINDARRKAAYVQQFQDDPTHGVRHHIQHRLDVRTEDSIEQALPTILNARYAFASLNDHTPGQGQYRDVDGLIRIAHEQAEARNGTKTDPEWYRERMRRAMEDTHTVPAFYQRVGELMALTDLKLATHDDDTIEKVDEQLLLGATVAEFPVTFEAAQHARDNDLAIVVGAPNIVRGGSQSGNLNATDLISQGLADIICSDYHSPSLLPAAWRLVELGLLDLPAAVRMLTANPAAAVGMGDRGTLEVGKLGDLCIVRVDDEGWPHCEATIVGGLQAFHFTGAMQTRRSDVRFEDLATVAAGV